MKSGFLSGYKTYILAALAVLSALAGYAMGDLSLMDMLQQIWMGGIAASFRNGLSVETQKAAQKAAERDYNIRQAQKTAKL